MFSPKRNTFDAPKFAGNESTPADTRQSIFYPGETKPGEPKWDFNWPSSPTASNFSSSSTSHPHDRASFGLRLASKLESLITYMSQDTSRSPTNIRALERAVDRALRVIQDDASSLSDLKDVEKHVLRAVEGALSEIPDELPPRRELQNPPYTRRRSIGRRGSRQDADLIPIQRSPSPVAGSNEEWVFITDLPPRRSSLELPQTPAKTSSRSKKNVSSPKSGKAIPTPPSSHPHAYYHQQPPAHLSSTQEIAAGTYIYSKKTADYYRPHHCNM
ncbi:hypothetical protein OF83DRAFT_462637 [Amylostereum chailletii]|nr:hypothetical protein OF83DRAFT_462637 [Amylostereum chailletii]